MHTLVGRPRSYPFWQISALCWPLAILGFTAAAALFTGVVDLGPEANSRLIADSPVLAGVIVLAAVGLPMAVAAHQAGAHTHRSARTAFIAGVLLVATMAIHIVVTLEFVALQPLLIATGVVVAALGYREMSTPRHLREEVPAPRRTVNDAS